MAKFCTECGKEIAAGVAFCTECGTKAPADPAHQTAETMTEVKTGPKVEVSHEAPLHTPPAPDYQAQQTYNQPAQTVCAPPAPDSATKAVGTGTYFGLMLLFALPIVGIISVIAMSFGAKNKNIKNFAKANLIWAIIAFVLSIATIIGMIAIGNSILEYIKQTLEGSLGDIPIS